MTKAELDGLLRSRVDRFVVQTDRAVQQLIADVVRVSGHVLEREVDDDWRGSQLGGDIVAVHGGHGVDGDHVCACGGTGHSHHPVFGRDTIIICRICEGVIARSCGVKGCPWA